MLIYVEDHLIEVVSKEVNANARMHTQTHNPRNIMVVWARWWVQKNETRGSYKRR